MAIWHDLVDDDQFPFAYASVKRFAQKLRGSPSPEARVVITTARFVITTTERCS
jgi:hypothetical protein